MRLLKAEQQALQKLIIKPCRLEATDQCAKKKNLIGYQEMISIAPKASEKEATPPQN